VNGGHKHRSLGLHYSCDNGVDDPMGDILNFKKKVGHVVMQTMLCNSPCFFKKNNLKKNYACFAILNQFQT